MPSHDFAIVGAGAIGCAIARELARAGAGRIVVIDRAKPGAEASSAAAGLLVVGCSVAPGGPGFALRQASAALYPTLAEELLEESGIDVEYSSTGLLEIALTGRQAARLRQLVARRQEQGIAADFLEAADARAREPQVNPDVQAGAWFPDDRSVHNTRLVEALHAAARFKHVEFRLDAPLTAVEQADGRVLAIDAGGERLTPGHLIIATGVWSREIGELLRVKIPVRPDRGEMVAVQPKTPLNSSLSWKEGYLVQRKNGEVLIGSTSAKGETEKTVSAASLGFLLKRAIKTVPSLGDATLLRTWAGLRPMSTLRRPIIGPLRGYTNVTIATGHHRAGILLTPITAKLVAELLLQDTTSLSLAPFCHKPR